MSTVDEMAVFAEVVEAGSFVGAARRIGLTPSGVSRKISRYEERLGVRLFNRTTRALSLTEAGEALYEKCTEILTSLENAESMVGDLRGAPVGELRVAASDALSVEVLVPFFKSFLAKHKNLSIVLVQGDGAIDMLNERIDVALTFAPPSETTFIARKLIDDPWVICAAPAYLKRRGVPQSPKDLSAHDCLTIHARGVTTDHWDFVNGEKTETIKVNSIYSGIGLTVKTAALAGLGVCRLAHFLVRKELDDGRLVPLLSDALPVNDRAIFAVYPNREHLPVKVRRFVDAASRHVKTTLKSPATK